MLLVVQAAQAGSCCVSAGSQPTALASCDRLGFVLGAGGDVAYGGWALDRSWRASGDDLDANATLSVSGMGRLAPWLQLGARVPMTLALTALDGSTATTLGLGEALAWVDVETPAGWPNHRTRAALELGVRGGGVAHPDTVIGQLGLRAAQDAGPWTLWASATGGVPLVGTGPATADGGLQLDHAIGAHRLGIGAGLSAELGTWPSVGTTVGPSFTFALSGADRLLVGLRAGLPIGGVGQNAASRVLLTVDWYRAVLHT